MAKDRKKTKNLSHLDEIDRRILNILSQNSRTKLTSIAREVGLSADSTKKRIKKLEESVIMKYTIRVNDFVLGLPLGVHVHVKLKDVTKEAYDELINFLAKSPRVIDLMGMLGDYDLFIVFIAKDTEEMDQMKLEIRQKFGGIIDNWEESVTSKLYRLEEYRF